ncbi:helix-turn-helix transcriptional regulator [Kutzneria sp. CA-103260]|uniref:helix-turn-helix transcriptional regulator n=1 Tax=Kutzneria sp. CA-103260 TaxID=2802641 RepID=UPI001BA81F8C|nr:LuxR C-terminal-related transcriptional regulator [Kutzneria sp. CA-103260]
MQRALEKLTEPPASAAWPLRGHDEPIRRIKRLMRETTEQHQGHLALLVSGAGTGKTRLLLEAMSLAAQSGFTVLDGAPKSLTTVGPRHGRHDNDQISWLDGHLRRGPVLVVLDDVQWTDPAMLRAVGALTSRLDDAPVLWLFALRAEHAESANGLWLRNLARTCRSEWLGPLEPLSGDAVVDIVGDLLGAVPDDDLVMICESVGGTPQAIVDLALGLREQGLITVDDRGARLVSGPLTSGIPCAVVAEPGAQLPRPLLQVVRGRLSELSSRAQDVLQVAAVLGRGFAPTDLAEMLNEPPAQLLGPLREALDSRLLSCGGGEFAFHREPVWQAVLDTVPEPLRSMLHRQAATMLLGRGEDRPEAAAVHLVHCAETGDAHAIATIREAAQRLLPASPHAAAALATRGMEITEPAGPDHIALAITATAALVRLGELTRAIDLARALLPENGHPSAMRPLRIWLATALMLRGDSSTWDVSQEIFGTGSVDGADLPPSLLLLNALSHNNRAAVIGLADRVLAVPGAHCDDVRAAALNVRAMASWCDGRIDDALATVEEAVRLREQLNRMWHFDPLWTKAWLLTRIRRLDEALAVAEAAYRAIEAERMDVLIPVPLALRATILLAKGDITAAEADATAGLAASDMTEMPLYEPQLRAVLVIIALRRGDLAAAADGLQKLAEASPAERARPWSAVRCTLAGLVALARRGPRAAIDEIGEVLADPALRTQFVLEDPSVAAWTVRTALAADQRRTAELMVATAEEIAAANRDHGVVAAAARHCRALLDGDVQAFAGIEDLYGDPWAAASVIEDIGSLHCDTDREQAVEELNRALASYDELGAEWDSARIRHKLRQLGVRRRHWSHEARSEAGWGSLTGTEEKVARLVARGLTNRQVASELFISPHTVGFHLRQIYRKLSIQSRVDLARIAP